MRRLNQKCLGPIHAFLFLNAIEAINQCGRAKSRIMYEPEKKTILHRRRLRNRVSCFGGATDRRAPAAASVLLGIDIDGLKPALGRAMYPMAHSSQIHMTRHQAAKMQEKQRVRRIAPGM